MGSIKCFSVHFAVGVCEDQVQANTSQPEVAHFPVPVSTDAVFSESHIPVVLQMESQWVSEQQSKLQTMKKDRLSLETKEDFGNGAFALLQRHHVSQLSMITLLCVL